jgi:hypothetical protein
VGVFGKVVVRKLLLREMREGRGNMWLEDRKRALNI